MPSSLLQTKLYIPLVRSDLVPRPRLIERLNGGLHRKLTLIAAPAGFGKTTLVSDWLHQKQVPTAWLSLDEGDNDPTRFLAYLIAALQTIAARQSPNGNIGEGALRVLQSSQPPPIESILTDLLNEITAIPNNFILVLDDYHVIDAKPIDQALTFLLEHLPPQMHLIITTREDPQLPLSRLRVRDQLTELRAADLRFAPAEAAEFLNRVMNLNLSAVDIATLETRTEGWIAGLQLAALSIQGREDIPGFINAFAGDNRYIAEYLVEEVLQRQPEQVRNFLFQTAILNRLSGPLCDAVTGQGKGKAMLQALEQGNLFIVPLDDKGQWYRYHHLFAEALLARLRADQPDQIPILHQRASVWYEQNDLPSEAIRHALTAEMFERAADLIELVWPTMERNRQAATWLGWVRGLPETLLHVRPVLNLDYGWALLSVGELEAGETRLREVERWLDTTADTSERLEETVITDEAGLQSLPLSLATARAYHAQALGDVSGTEKYTQRAFDLLPEEDSHRRARPTSILALAYWSSGDLAAAARLLADAMTNAHRAGNVQFAITGTYVLTDILKALGRFHEAISSCEQSLQLAADQGELVPRGTADILVGLSGLYLEQGDLESAIQQLQRSERLGEKAASPYWKYRLRLAQARMKAIQGELDEALEQLDEAERHYVRGPAPEARPITALKMRLWLAQGKLTDALAWADKQGLSINDDLSYLREFEHITLTRIYIAQYKRDDTDQVIFDAFALLERLLKAAEDGRRMRSVIEILVLQALAHQAQGNIPPALESLERALILAEPERYVQIFVDEGPPLTQLLYEALSQGITPDYVQRLLAVFPVGKLEKTVSSKQQAQKSELIEPLTKRETEVLHLIAEGLTNQEIATKLFLALNTVKVHTRNIYSKLGAHHRADAVAKAKMFGILVAT